MRQAFVSRNRCSVLGELHAGMGDTVQAPESLREQQRYGKQHCCQKGEWAMREHVN